MAGHAQLKFVITECSKTQIRLTGLKTVLKDTGDTIIDIIVFYAVVSLEEGLNGVYWLANFGSKIYWLAKFEGKFYRLAEWVMLSD